MNVTRKSVASGITRTLDLPITQEQIDRFKGGALIQDAFPHLTLDQREFMLTGMTAEEWDTTMADDEEDHPRLVTDRDLDDEAAF